jgi:hypothetical protein
MDDGTVEQYSETRRRRASPRDSAHLLRPLAGQINC